ncbi:hypothetical protein NMY22_g10382 [Coprinellus aureogranulatus]|nr:hypothetical protein NMY22_g10382 [Coprinellus aureogranulatus]
MIEQPTCAELVLDVHRALKKRYNLQELVDISFLDSTHRLDAKFELERRVRRQLLHFGLDMDDTLQAMEKHGALISGSVALAVLFPDEQGFFGNDVDFYLANDKASDFVNEILQMTDYKIVKSNPGSPHGHPEEGPSDKSDSEDQHCELYPCTFAKRVLWLKNGEGRAMNIIETTEDHPFKMVRTFYTTLVMNAITSSGVYCLYPELTLSRIGVVKDTTVYDEDLLQANILKYADRGFDIHHKWGSPGVQHAIGPHICGEARCCPFTVRDTRAGHSFLWMSFNSQAGTSPYDVVPDTKWTHYTPRTTITVTLVRKTPSSCSDL